MYSRVQLSIFLLLFLFLGVVLAVPARIRRKRTDECVPEMAPTGTDAGPLDECKEATLCFCENIGHPVPASVAAIANILEKQIKYTHDNLAVVEILQTNACAEAVKEIQCTQSFPECSSESGTVRLSTPNDCEDRIRGNCGPLAQHLLDDGICRLSNGSYSQSECKPVTSYDYEFQHCPVSDSVKVTPWIFEIMKRADLKLEYQFSQLNGFGDLQFEGCRENYARFSCQIQGQCQDGGQRAEIVNDYQLCDNIANCYSQSYLAGTIRDSFVCELWPSPFSTTMDTITTPQTSSSVASSETIFTAEPTWPTPSGTSGTPSGTSGTTADTVVVGGASQVNSLPLCVTVLIAFAVILQWFYN